MTETLPVIMPSIASIDPQFAPDYLGFTQSCWRGLRRFLTAFSFSKNGSRISTPMSVFPSSICLRAQIPIRKIH
jgi:hypothetical protein